MGRARMPNVPGSLKGSIGAVFFNIASVLRIRTYALIAIAVSSALAVLIPLATFYIAGMWIYAVRDVRGLPSVLGTLTSYILAGIFVSLLAYSRRMRVSCRDGVCLGTIGAALSIVGCCSPIIYVLFLAGMITSFVIPYLTFIPALSILLLAASIYMLAYRIGRPAKPRRREIRLDLGKKSATGSS